MKCVEMVVGCQLSYFFKKVWWEVAIGMLSVHATDVKLLYSNIVPGGWLTWE